MIAPSELNAGRSLAEHLGGGVGAHALVGGDGDRVALALRHLDGHDLVVEDAVGLGPARAHVRGGGDLVLLLAGESVAGVEALGGRAHRVVVERVGEAVGGGVVEHLDAAVRPALARAGHEQRRLGHRLLAAGHDDGCLAEADQPRGIRDGDEARQADLVDGGGGHAPRDAGRDGGLLGGVLAGAGLEHLAHDHGVDVVGGDPGLLERAADRHGAELHRRLAREVAVDAGERGAGSGDDDDVGDAHRCWTPSSRWGDRPDGSLCRRGAGRSPTARTTGLCISARRCCTTRHCRCVRAQCRLGIGRPCRRAARRGGGVTP